MARRTTSKMGPNNMPFGRGAAGAKPAPGNTGVATQPGTSPMGNTGVPKITKKGRKPNMFR